MDDVDRLLARIDALQALLAVYRAQGHPSEKLFRELDSTREDELLIRGSR